MKKRIGGITPVMITPFDEAGRIDWTGLEALIEWYLSHGAQALFAVCLSSEMYHLSPDEQLDLARFIVRQVDGRVPVLASGHMADNIDAQQSELAQMAKTGIDCLVLVTNRLGAPHPDNKMFRENLGRLVSVLPSELKLGMYECPAPFRRLLTDDEISILCDDPRFIFIKDVSCEAAIVKNRIAQARGSALAINNANAAIAYEVLKAGGDGFCGVFTNFHPDLYRWLQDHAQSYPELGDELSIFLALAASTETMGYPKLAKHYHLRLGTFKSAFSRAVTGALAEDFLAVDAVLDKIAEGSNMFRHKISHLNR